jgi:hypothetical protein
MKKKILITGFLLCLLFTSGCLEALTGQQTGEIRTFSQKVDNYQEVVNELKEAFVADKVITEKMADNVDKVNEWLDENQPVLEKIATDVENAPDNVANKVATGIGSAAPLIPPPYNAYAIGISSLIAAIFGKKAVDNGRALAKESGKRRSEKAGVRKTITELAATTSPVSAAEVEAKLFKNIGDERARNGLT